MTELHFPELRRSTYRLSGPPTVLGVLRWQVSDGTQVRAGQPLADVRVLGGDGTDVLTALATGTLWHQARDGELLPPGGIVGLIE